MSLAQVYVLKKINPVCNYRKQINRILHNTPESHRQNLISDAEAKSNDLIEQILKSHGDDDITFLTKLSKSRDWYGDCPVCLELPGDATIILRECGHIICENCWKEYKKYNKMFMCQCIICKSFLSGKFYPALLSPNNVPILGVTQKIINICKTNVFDGPTRGAVTSCVLI